MDVFLVTPAAGFPAGHAVHREDAALLGHELGGAQQVLVLPAVEANRRGVVLKQVDHRRAVQPHVGQRGADTLCTGFLDIEAQLQAARLLEPLFRQTCQDLEALDVDEQEFVGKDEVFLQVAVAAKGIERVGNQCLVFGEAYRLDLPGVQSQRRQRLLVRAQQRLALIVQDHHFDTAEMP